MMPPWQINFGIHYPSFQVLCVRHSVEARVVENNCMHRDPVRFVTTCLLCPCISSGNPIEAPCIMPHGASHSADHCEPTIRPPFQSALQTVRDALQSHE